MKEINYKDALIIVTGIGYKKAIRIFSKSKTADILSVNGVNYKLNIGAVTAKLLAQRGARVCMVARNEEALSYIKKHICEETNCKQDYVSFACVDLLDQKAVKSLVRSLGKESAVWLVHSVGLGSQAYSVNGDNPYLPFTQINPDLVTKEFEAPVRSLLLLVQNLEPKIAKQIETRIVVITSMSGIRPYMYGYSHASAKAGLHNAVRSLSLELNYKYKSVYLSEILPGIVDTGLYDSEEVIKSVQKIGETFGFSGKKKYNANNFPLMPPSSVAEAVVLALTSKAQILSINMVAHGQFPHMGG